MAKNAAIILLTIALIVLSMLLNKGCNDAARVNNNYNIALSELNKYKDNQGREVSSIIALQADYHELQQMNSNLNTTIADLKKQVKKKSETVIVQKIRTTDTINVPTIIYVNDSNRREAHYADEWATIDVNMGSDSTSINYSVTNKFVHKQEWKRRNIFASPMLEGSVTNLNPHTSTQEYISYKKKAPKRTGVKVAIFIAGLVGGVMIAR